MPSNPLDSFGRLSAETPGNRFPSLAETQENPRGVHQHQEPHAGRQAHPAQGDLERAEPAQGQPDRARADRREADRRHEPAGRHHRQGFIHRGECRGRRPGPARGHQADPHHHDQRLARDVLAEMADEVGAEAVGPPDRPRTAPHHRDERQAVPDQAHQVQGHGQDRPGRIDPRQAASRAQVVPGPADVEADGDQHREADGRLDQPFDEVFPAEIGHSSFARLLDLAQLAPAFDPSQASRGFPGPQGAGEADGWVGATRPSSRALKLAVFFRPPGKKLEVFARSSVVVSEARVVTRGASEFRGDRRSFDFPENGKERGDSPSGHRRAEGRHKWVPALVASRRRQGSPGIPSRGPSRRQSRGPPDRPPPPGASRHDRPPRPAAPPSRLHPD